MGDITFRVLKLCVAVVIIIGLINVVNKAVNIYDETLVLNQREVSDKVSNMANKAILSLDKKQSNGKIIIAQIPRITRSYTILFKKKPTNYYIVYGKLIESINATEVSDKKYIVSGDLPDTLPYNANDFKRDVKILYSEPLLNFNKYYYGGEQYYIRSDLYYYTYVIYDKLRNPRILVIEEV